MASGQGAGRPQRRMGPAPFASLEDLSDEADTSPTEPAPVRLPGIHEDGAGPGSPAPPGPGRTASGCGGGGGLTPGTPRIDISRASSSSHHEDSRDSTPERELFQGPGDKPCARLGLAFTEEGALELRSSTEELDFHEERRRDGPDEQHQQQQRQQRHRSHHQQQRKDSQGSDVGLLSISGRTSRLSSVGSSQGSGGRVSDASRLSVASGASRSPSPHKMLLETSFCGSRTCLAGEAAAPQSTVSVAAGVASPELETELLERVLLSRRHDPTEAVLAEGISIECRRKIQPAPPVPLETCAVESEKSSARSSPLPTPGKTIVSDSGVEYTFIPLKGPLPASGAQPQPQPQAKARAPEPKREPPKSSNEPQYIRIKLKPDHMYADVNHCGPPPVQKPDSLDLGEVRVESRLPVRAPPPPAVRCTPSPVSRKNSFVSLFRGSASPESPCTRKRLSLTAEGARSRSKSSDRIGQGAVTRPAASKPNHHRSVFALFKPKRAGASRETSPPPPPSAQAAAGAGSGNAGLAGLAFSFRREQPLEGDSIIIPLHSPSEQRDTFLHTNEPEPEVAPTAAKGQCKPDTDTASRQRTPDLGTARHAREPDKTRAAKEARHAKDAEKVRLRGTSESPKPRAPKESDAKVDKSEHVVRGECRRSSTTSSENLVFSTKLGADNDDVFTTKLTKQDIAPVSVGDALAAERAALAAERAARTPEPAAPPPIPAPLPPQPLPSPQPSIGAASSGRLDGDVVDSSEQESEDKAAAAEGSDGSGSEHERKGLVMQQDSFEDELPYVPTTLPLERSVAVPMVPIKQRAACEVRTCPIERPRSTTPINPAGALDAYQRPGDAAPPPPPPAPKLKISLPWDESGRRSPSRRSGSIPPPPLPPRGAPAAHEWVNFDDIPERRKPPKRIQTIPSRTSLGLAQPAATAEDNVVYSYVNPEDCKCECHEAGARPVAAAPERREDELPLLLTADRRSDSSLESQASAPPPPPPKRLGAGGRPRAPS